MQRIAELLVRIADLAEAEGRALRAMTVRVAFGVCMLVVAAAVLLAGALLLIAAAYLATAQSIGPAGASALAGGIALGGGGGLLWLGRRSGS